MCSVVLISRSLAPALVSLGAVQSTNIRSVFHRRAVNGLCASERVCARMSKKE